MLELSVFQPVHTRNGEMANLQELVAARINLTVVSAAVESCKLDFREFCLEGRHPLILENWVELLALRIPVGVDAQQHILLFSYELLKSVQ